MEALKLAYIQLQHKLAYIFHKAAILLKSEATQTVYMESRKRQEQNITLTILGITALLSQHPNTQNKTESR
jgi:hypothetical protein